MLERFPAPGLLFVSAFLLVAGCSDQAATEAPDPNFDPSAFATHFERGFQQAEAETLAAIDEDAGTAAAPDADTPFRRSNSRTPQVETMVANNLAENLSLGFVIADPASFVRSGETREIYQRALAARNYPSDTLAGATALMFSVAWELANQRKLSPAGHAAILRDATAKLQSDQLATKGDEERQAQSDIALIIAALWLEEARLRQQSPDQLRELSDAVNRDMKKMSGTDMRTHTVTAAGLVTR